jgi:hypothetical protein
MTVSRRNFTLFVVLSLGLVLSACGDSARDRLKDQTNTSLTFYGLAVDETGQPLPLVEFEFLVESFADDWSFERRGEPLKTKSHRARSGRDGRFIIHVVGHTLWLERAELRGYQHLHERQTGSSLPSDNIAYALNSWGDLLYRADPENPAVYVFVKDGVRVVSALPNKGGADSSNGTVWRKNLPAWPEWPSLPDVVYKPPATQPVQGQPAGG